jgi:predicted ATPase
MLYIAIQAALRLSGEPETDPLTSVCEALSPLPNALLILDNLEQLLPTAAPRVWRLLEQVPSLTCLVTSRRRLGLPGERERIVPPLPTPLWGAGMHGSAAEREVLGQIPAVALFVDRAQAVRTDFQITRANARAIAELCRRLEGIPLALEMAAARALTLTPAQMLGQLAQRLDLLVSRRNDGDARRRTLRATIDWSYDLLSAELRFFFACLSVFQGGGTMDAAQAVTGEPRAADYLMALREHSLLSVVTPPPAPDAEEPEAAEEPLPRFVLLETLREYAAEQLAADVRGSLMRRHADYLLALLRVAQKGLLGPAQSYWQERLEAEHDNLRAALDWCAEDTDGPEPDQPSRAEMGLWIAAALGRFWLQHGYVSEGRARLTTALERAPRNEDDDREEIARLRADALTTLAAMCKLQGDYATAQTFLEESLTLRRRTDDREGIANALIGLGNLAHRQSDLATARSYFEESLALYRASGNEGYVAKTLGNLGVLALEQGDYAGARRLMESCLAVHRKIGDAFGVAVTLGNLGNVALGEGDYPAAQALLEEALAMKRAGGDKLGIALTLGSLGEVLRYQEQWEEARARQEESLALHRESGDPAGAALALYSLGNIARDRGEVVAARTLYAEALTAQRHLGDPESIANTLDGFASLAAGRTSAGNSAASALRAARLWGAASALRAETETALPPNEQRHTDSIMTAAREQVGASPFDAAFTAGQALTMEQAVGFALEESGAL